ncbi:CHAD domain-containing protein [Methylosarcina fibrata]|uniref:CHAD domain-containing protein n=1 Tax=Methylosarcina fibrata TaxID=105972 RepID=UPI00037CA167|nr:CHAD domain-containing protein [Methylosarcina fibrata]
MSLQFELPANLSAEKFLAELSEKADIQLISRHYCLRTYYDSFDWRLWSNGIVCEFNRSKVCSSLSLRTLKNGRILAGSEIAEVPPFPRQLTAGIVQDSLQSLLGIRALLAICTLDYEAYQLNLLNKDKKTLVRLDLEEYELCNNRLLLQPIKGYEQAAENLTRLLTGELGLTVTDKPVLLIALELQGRHPKDYSSKLKLTLDPALPADMAVKTIFGHLLKAIKLNEHGMLADIDSEFLHDFRVAVRRTRTGLKQLKGVLPEEVAAYYSDFFSWLGQVTCPTRDLDVHLIQFEHYKSVLPENIRDDLNPLYDFLLKKKQQARQDMLEQLKSPRYLTTLLEWEQYLKQQPLQAVQPASPAPAAKTVANRSIWKMYNRALRQGKAITPESPAENLHTLRKTCKKLRYLIEFFQSLYSESHIKHLLKDLKELQTVLGDFQDYTVQEQAIQQFSEEMIQSANSAKTFLAMGVLVQILDEKKWQTRAQFSSCFEHFTRNKNHSIFKSLFASDD